MSVVNAAPAGGQQNPAAYWTKLLGDPAFRAMPVDQRASLLTRHVQEARAQQHGGANMQLGQTVGAVPKVQASPAPPSGAHPLDAALADPKANHMAALQAHVYGP